jgi:hypothetical protein
VRRTRPGRREKGESLVTRTDLAVCLLSLMLLPLTLAHAELASGEGFIEGPGGKVW